MVYDPSAGDSWAECVDLNGNPEIDEDWPSYELKYTDEEGAEIKRDGWSDDQIPFHEFMRMSREERAGKTPFINLLGRDGKLDRMAAATEMVTLAEDRLLFWDQLRELAGYKVAPSVRDQITYELEDEFDQKAASIRAEYEAKILELKTTYPQIIARKMAEGLIASSRGGEDKVGEVLKRASTTPGLRPVTFTADQEALVSEDGGGTALAAPPAPVGTAATEVMEAPPTVEEDEDDDALVMDPYIDTARCTSCNECTNINKKLFAYNAAKQAYIKDATAGPFAEIVQAAERCTAKIIHPGTPLNPRERDIEKWIERAKPFNG
jgi:pyruvate-ferredoxin/flavodoxin oxidoreductase